MLLALGTLVTWRQAQTIRAMRDRGLHPGFPTFLAWVQSEKCPFSEQYTRKLLDIAEAFDDEHTAIRAGVTRGYELIRVCQLTGQNPKLVVLQDQAIAGRPFSQHTRKSLADVVRSLEAQAKAQAISDAAEELGTDDGRADADFERPEVTPLPREVERTANRDARTFLRWAHSEGADQSSIIVYKYQDEPWATVKLPARQLPLLLD